MSIIQHTIINAVESDTVRVREIVRWINNRDDQRLFVVGPVMVNGHVTISLVASGSGLGRATENLMVDVRRDFENFLRHLNVPYVITSFGELGVQARYAGETVGQLAQPS